MLIAISALLFLFIALGVRLALVPNGAGQKTHRVKQLKGVTGMSALSELLLAHGWIEVSSDQSAGPDEQIFARGDMTARVRDEQHIVIELKRRLDGELPEHFQLSANPNTAKLRVALTQGLETWDVSSVEAFALLGVAPQHLHQPQWRRLHIADDHLTLMSEGSDCLDGDGLERYVELTELIAIECKSMGELSASQLAHKRLERPQDKAAWTLCLRILLSRSASEQDAQLMSWLNAHHQDVQLSALFKAHSELLLNILPAQAILKLNLPHSPKLAQALFERGQLEEILADPNLQEGLRLELCRLALRRLSPAQANAAVAAAIGATPQRALSELLARLLPQVEDRALWSTPPCHTALRSRLRELRAPESEQVFKSFSDQLATPIIQTHYAALLREPHARGCVPDAALMTLLTWPGWRPDEVTLRAVAKRLRQAHDRDAVSLAECWALWLGRTDWSVDPFELIRITVNAQRQQPSRQDLGILRFELMDLLGDVRLGQEQLHRAELIDLLMMSRDLDDTSQTQSALVYVARTRFEALPAHPQVVRWLSYVLGQQHLIDQRSRKTMQALQSRFIDELGLRYEPGAMMLVTHQDPVGALTQSGDGEQSGALTVTSADED